MALTTCRGGRRGAPWKDTAPGAPAAMGRGRPPSSDLPQRGEDKGSPARPP